MAKPQYGADHTRRRRAWERELRRTGGRQCACRGQCGHHKGQCQTWITPDNPWDLMHGTAHTHGGDGTDSQPGCPPCNRAEGGHLAHQHPSSEDWW